jgi:uncharacterized ion transporter superfamily protein YfcC
MANKGKLPGPITVLMIVIILGAIGTWVVPAGEYNKLSVSDNKFLITSSGSVNNLPLTQQTLDSLTIKIALEKFTGGAIRKPVAIPGTYHSLPKNGQGLISILSAPLKGIYDSIDIILFVLVIGGFMFVFNESGAMVKGTLFLSHAMKGKEAWLIIILTFLFSFAGSSFGMAEEALVFYPVMVPLFLAAGYDLIIPVVVIFGGTQLGSLSSFSNPFATIIASNAAGVNWKDGLNERVIMFAISTVIMIWYVARYAKKIKKDPTESIVFKLDGAVKSPFESVSVKDETVPKLDWRTRLMLILFLFTFLGLISGVVFFHWWLTEMTTLFLGSSILVAFLLRIKENVFVTQFIKGAANLLPVAFIVGVARGVTIVLNDGHISDSIIFYSARLVSSMPPAIFIVMLLALYIIFTLFISSSSGMAVLTMPIMGALAIIVNVPGREIVNAYLYGMGIMGFITPTGLMLPSLALANVSLKAWLKFMLPLMLILSVLCAVFLIVGVFKK